MKIVLHGGNCCGIKTIKDLGPYPSEFSMMLAARKPLKRTSFGQALFASSNDMRTYNKKSNCDFFNEAAPRENPLARFDRFVAFIKQHRPHHCIEVVINWNQKAWIPALEERGFKLSCTFNNSNTHATVYVYHLVY